MMGARKLATYLKNHGLTQLQFAERAGVSGPAVSMWLRGVRRPELECVYKIERATRGEVAATDWLLPVRRAARSA